MINLITVVAAILIVLNVWDTFSSCRVKDRRKAMAIQRVIDRKMQWAKEHHMGQSLHMYCVGCGYDLYGRK